MGGTDECWYDVLLIVVDY